MGTCDNCGGPLARSFDVPTTCEYCGVQSPPLPREVSVPVPLNITHNVVQVTGLPNAPQELRCPHCRKRLVTVDVKDVALHGCGGCGGIWVDNQSARRVLAEPDAIFGELATRASRNARRRDVRASRAVCPACPALLDRSVVHGIELDICSEHGTWFDANELTRLVRVLNEPAKRNAPPDPNRMTQCSGCQTPLRVAEANLGDQGLQCDGCWRARQKQLVAEGEVKVLAEGPVNVAGALLDVASAMLSGLQSMTLPPEGDRFGRR